LARKYGTTFLAKIIPDLLITDCLRSHLRDQVTGSFRILPAYFEKGYSKVPFMQVLPTI
jgi:hypothetical protein